MRGYVRRGKLTTASPGGKPNASSSGSTGGDDNSTGDDDDTGGDASNIGHRQERRPPSTKNRLSPPKRQKYAGTLPEKSSRHPH